MRRLVDATGHVVAEIADDRVTARRLLPLDGSGDAAGAAVSWREIEVEVDDDAADLLDAVDARLRKGGLQAAAAASKLAHVLDLDRRGATEERKATKLTVESTGGDVILAHIREQVEQVQAQDLPVRLDAPDAVHKMRVATRRLRSALTTFKPLFAADVVRPLRDELKWLAGELGAARDAEVMRDRVRKAVEADPEVPESGSVAEDAAAELEGAYRTAHDRVLAELDGERYHDILLALDRLVTSPPCTDRAAAPAAEVLPRRVKWSFRRVRRLVDEADATPAGAEREELRHDARKAAKQARYAGGVGEPGLRCGRHRLRGGDGGRAGGARGAPGLRSHTREVAGTGRAHLEHRCGFPLRPPARSRGGAGSGDAAALRRGVAGGAAASPCTAGCARRRGDRASVHRIVGAVHGGDPLLGPAHRPSSTLAITPTAIRPTSIWMVTRLRASSVSGVMSPYRRWRTWSR